MENPQTLINTIGQYCYHTIKKPWQSAKLILEYPTKDHAVKYVSSLASCSANYIPEEDSFSNQANIEELFITDTIKNELFQLAQNDCPEPWQRAVFSINRNGKFNLSFEQDDSIASLNNYKV